MRISAIGLAVVLAGALLSQASPTAEAGSTKARKGGAVATELLEIAHQGLKGKKPGGRKAKRSAR